MIINFDTIENTTPVFTDKFIPIVSKKPETYYVDVGAKTLPINLNDVFKKGLAIIKNTNLQRSNFVTSSVYIHYNNIKNNNNILYNNLYTKCDKNTTVDDDTILNTLKSMAKNELIDIHYFPVKYNSSSNHNKENAYVEYNLRWVMIAMLEMEQALQWLVGYNQNIQFIVETRDVEKTLWSVANRLSNNNEIKYAAVRKILEIYTNNGIDKDYIASKFRDFWWNIDWFIGEDKYFANVTHFDTLEKNTYVPVSIYGDKREDSWRNITHKIDSSVCLYVDNNTKMMLKRIKNTMSGQKFHSYLKELIGKWFDLDDSKIWHAIRQNMCRIDDSTLEPEYDVETCKLYVKTYCDNMSKYYDIECVDLSNEADQETIAENTIIENNISTPSVVENTSELQETQRTAIVDEYIDSKNNKIAYINNTYEQYSWQWYDAMIQNGFMPVEM